MDIQRQLWWAGLHDIIQLEEGLRCTISLRVLTPQDKKCKTYLYQTEINLFFALFVKDLLHQQ